VYGGVSAIKIARCRGDRFEATRETKPDPAGGPDKIWPRSIQVQLHAPKAGSVLTHDGAKTDNMVSVNDLVTNPKKWNTCVVTCRGGALTVEINGKKAGSVTGCVPSSGHLALQSEGSEVHFRNIRVARLKKPATKAGS